MGFYGNVTNTSKTTFSFDIKYNTRVSMDRQVETDGVFLGRYVLIDYDDSPIKAYYNKENDRFYNTANFSLSSQITPRSDIIYQDLHNAMDALSFYKWDASQSRHVLIQSGTPYQENFSTDVKEYGRGYDSTVWVKQYDTTNDKYKYVMIAELNAVVPTLHMVVNQPNAIPVTPYFDRDTTNIDYYLHMQSDFGTRVKKADQKIKSDEEATRIMARWIQDESGYQTYEEYTETVPADIYYNDKGFDHIKRTFMEDKITYRLIDDNGEIIDNAPLKEIDYSKNSIGYDMGQSGRKYGIDADLGVYTNGVQADDVYDWYFRLPGIGNAICKMWDKVYDDRGNNQIRALNKSQMKNDTSDHLVSYNKETLIGMMNTTQDLLGYHFIPTNDTYKNGYTTTEKDATINVDLTYNTFEENNSTLSGSVQYKLLNCLFYDKPVQNNEAVTKYYHFAYTPTYTQVIGTTLQKDKQYYHFVDGIWEIANPAIYGQTDADGNPILDKNSNQTLSIGNYYTRNDKWTLMPITANIGDNIYSLINLIHSIIGTNADDVRSLDTMKGTINCIKDIIANIDLDLSPGKLLHTNNQGVIETTNTYFPSATWDEDKVLDGSGSWVSRFATVKILKNSIEDNQKNPEVNTIIDGVEQNVVTIIESDNDKSHTGTSLVNDKKHTTNNLTLGSRNKWIELYGNADTDSIEFKHSQSPIVTRLRAEQADGNGYIAMHQTEIAEDGSQIIKVDPETHNVLYEDKTGFENFTINDKATEIKVEPTTKTLSYVSGINDKNDNRLTIPYITVDNAGHVVELGTKNFNVPHTFKYLTISDDNTDDFETGTRATPGTLEADQLTDTWTMAPQNKWIDISKDTDDGITIGHKYSELSEHDFVTDVVIDDDIDGVSEHSAKDCVYTIPLVKTDNAGHIIGYSTKSIYIPYNYRNIVLLEQSTNETQMDVSNGMQEADTTTDTFTFATGNQWIRARVDEDKITYAHALINKERKVNWQFIPEATDGWKHSDDKNKLTIPIFDIDNAGHVINNSTTDFYIPNNFRNIHLLAQSTDNTAVTASNTKVEMNAKSIVDTFTFATGNKWVQTTGDETNNKITFSHILSDVTKDTYGTNNATALAPQFGDTFLVPGYAVDEAGHITSSSTHTVKIPQNSYSNDDAEKTIANVITGMSLNQATGAITTTSQNVGTLTLAGYTKLDTTATAAIAATDTLNIAIAKLQQQIDTEAATRIANVTDLQSQINTEIQNRTKTDNDLQSQLTAEAQSRTEKDNNLQSQLDKINWLANYIDFEALYATVSARLESEYGISKLPIEEG